MDDTRTLQEGLDDFYKKNSQYFAERPQSEKAKQFLRNHDVAHVVFDCDTSIYGEGVVKIWTTFGTTLSFWKVITSYNEADAFELFKMYSFRHVSKNIFKVLKSIPKTILRARRMSQAWPFEDYDNYLNTPLVEIRKMFNIEVVD